MAPPPDEGTSFILHGQPLIDVASRCRIEEIRDAESDGPAPAITQDPAFSSSGSQQNLESQVLSESSGDPITGLSAAEDPVSTVAEVPRTQVR